jgi:hypothetical protein
MVSQPQDHQTLPPDLGGVIYLETAQVMPTEEALYRLMGNRRRSSPDLQSAVEAALAEAGTLIRPAAVWSKLGMDSFTAYFPAPLNAQAQAGRAELIGVVCTIGGTLEERSHTLFAAQEYLQGYLLDQIGSYSVAKTAQLTADRLRVEHQAMRWAPGDSAEDWYLTTQRLLFERLPAHLIGVRLTEQNVMIPLKSLSYFLLVDSGTAGLRCLIPCHRCVWNGSCDKRLRQLPAGTSLPSEPSNRK